MSRWSLAAAVAAVMIAAASLAPPAKTPPPAPAPATGGPAELRAAFAAVQPADRAVVGGVYGALAEAVERDSALVTSTKVLADGIGRSLDLAFHGRKPSQDGSLGVAIDKHVSTALGFPAEAIPDVVITPTLRAKIVAALRDVAAAAR